LHTKNLRRILQAGTTNVLIDGLPGPPDGVSLAADGENFWVSLVGRVPPYAALLRPSAVRVAIAWITEFITPPITYWGASIKVRGSSFLNMLFTLELDRRGTHTQRAATWKDCRLCV
jgi:hypothetical protein